MTCRPQPHASWPEGSAPSRSGQGEGWGQRVRAVLPPAVVRGRDGDKGSGQCSLPLWSGGGMGTTGQGSAPGSFLFVTVCCDVQDVTRLLEYDLGESGRIDKVHRSLIPMQDRFPQEPYRKLVKEGYLYYEDPENMLKKVYVHLFNDSLLLSFPMKWKFLTKHVFYHSATSYDAPFGGNDWDIKSPSRSIVVQGLMGDESVTLKLFGADRLERDDWYDEIDQTRKMWSETGNRLELDAVATANKLVPDAQRVGTRWKPPTKRAQIATVKNTPSKQGVLLCKLTSTSKGTKLKQNWKRRFVVVKDGVLRVYNGENAQGQPISTVQLHRAVISIPDRSDLKGDETKYAFAVSSANEKDLFAPQPNGKRFCPVPCLSPVPVTPLLPLNLIKKKEF